MTFLYNEFKRALAEGEIDLGSDDIRVMLLMTNTTADADDDANTISAIGTLDEYNGANYARKALANEAVVENAGSNRAEFQADDVVWSALGTGTRQCQAALVYKHVTNDADSVPICYIDDWAAFDGADADTTLAFTGGIVLKVT